MVVAIIIFVIIAEAVLFGMTRAKRRSVKTKDYYPFEPPIHPMCRCTVHPIGERPKRRRRRPKGQTGRKHPKKYRK